jgi:hypothetical protein
MSRIAAAFTLAASLLVPALSAQSSENLTASVPACLPSSTLEQLTKALDDAVSGPADKDRACLREVVLPDARLIPLFRTPDGVYSPHTLTVDGWIDAVRKRGNTVFYERQVKVKTETYGHMAHLWSTYEIRPTPDAKATVRGINSIQAVFDGQRWRVAQILWEAETPSETIPEKYLP